jgi:hypothetical protein
LIIELALLYSCYKFADEDLYLRRKKGKKEEKEEKQCQDEKEEKAEEANH